MFHMRSDVVNRERFLAVALMFSDHLVSVVAAMVQTSTGSLYKVGIN